MTIIFIRPWQIRLLLGLSFAVFVAGGYRWTMQSVAPVMTGPPPLDAPLFEVPGAAGQVALTINVDWGSEEIPAMLDLFDRYGARVTFFLTGHWAEQNAELVRTIAERGHEIANHGRSHIHPRQLADGALAAHITENEQLLASIAGKVSRLYAPPYGEWDRRVVRQAANLGYRTVLWTLDTRDWQEPSAETIVARVVPKAVPGVIVLMHPKPNTVAALPAIMDGLKVKGLQAVTLSEMLAAVAPQKAGDTSGQSAVNHLYNISAIIGQIPGSS